MEGASGQQYVVNVFGRGIAQDLLHDLPAGQVRDTYIRTERLAIGQKLINGLSSITGDAFVSEDFIDSADTMRLLALTEMNGYLYTFWSVSTGTIWIYRDDTLIGNHADFPGIYPDGHLYVDTNPDSSEIAITDDNQVPVVLDMDDMYDLRATTTYMADYNSVLYEVNQDVGLHQPAFIELTDIGAGGGVRIGSNAYSYRLVSVNDDVTPWSPPTPFIPVPVRLGGFAGEAGDIWPGAKLYGGDASLEASRYAINLKIRVVNEVGFDFVDIKRIANNVGGPVDYTASAEFIRYAGNITGVKHIILDFVDSAGLHWAPLDESNTVVNSIIHKAKTVRFFDGRLVLGGVTYKSVSFDTDDLFVEMPNALGDDMQATAFKEDIGIGGYKDIYNQVYKKSYKLGERYGFGITPWDLTGNSLYAVPVPGFSDFKFPNRREAFSPGHAGYSDGEIEAALNISYAGEATDKCHEVYKQGTTQRLDSMGLPQRNINVDFTYKPFGPTGRDIGHGGGGNDSLLANQNINTSVDGDTYQPDNFGHSILGTGLKFGGVDVAEFPAHISGFSVNRTDPAGRVVTQGLATYALTESDGATLDKALDKVWLHLPEVTTLFGDKTSLYDDLIQNPGDYEMQLVSPVGFNTDTYSNYDETFQGHVDMVSYANCYYAGGNTHPADSDAQVGDGDGYVTFGRWRNTNQGSGLVDAEVTFAITAVDNVSIDNKNGRNNFLEVTLGSNIYADSSMVVGVTGDAADARSFHEPWYVVNLIKDGKVIAQNNINLYKEIGQYIKLNSMVGEGNGDAAQEYPLVSERPGDVLNSNGSTSGPIFHRYIYVDDEPWLDGTNVAGGTITTYLTSLEGSGSFTPSGGLECFGMYSVDTDGNKNTIIFPHELPSAGTPIVPAVGDRVEVRYNVNEPVAIWGGDTLIDEIPIGIIDADTQNDWDGSQAQRDKHFQIQAAIPFREYTNIGGYIQSRDPADSGTPANQIELYVGGNPDYVRQWISTFVMESSMNLPFLYKNFFPYRNYVMRPMKYDYKDGDETVDDYLGRLNIHESYEIDYPGEYNNWGYGGFHLPSGYNFDHNKAHSKIYGSKPASGFTEVLSYPKRLHWTPKQAASRYGLGIINTFLATNIYDIKLKASNYISILYDEYTSKGNNLYAVMDRGVAAILTNKQVLRDGISDELGIILADSGFVQAELWLDPYVGSPEARWRGRAEGVIRTMNNTHIPGLVFIGDDDIYLLSGNSVISLGTNFRTTLKPLIEGLEWFSTLSAAFDPGRNELWLLISDDWYIYSFSVSNWVGKVSGTYAIALTSTKLYDSTRMTRIGVTYIGGGTHTSSIFKGDAGFEFETGNVSQGAASNRPTVEFAVTPAGASQFEFIDMFINSTTRPYNIIVATDAVFTDPYTVLAAGIKNINGLYRVTLGSTAAGKKLIANTLYVKIAFEFEQEVNVGYVKTGYKKVQGG